MKKNNIITFLFFFVLLLALFVPNSVSAKSINDYRNDLEALKKEKETAESNQAAIQNQIDNAKEQIAQITLKIADATTQQDNLNKEIKNFEDKIDEKEDQIKDLVSFYQLSSNENFYLKFLFGADSFEDFIYRFSVIEQLTTKSNELVNEMNDLISQNKIKLAELESTKAELNDLNAQVQRQISSLGSQKSTFIEEAESYDDQITAVEEKIQYYLDQGCNESEDLSYCLTSVPFDFGFNKPLIHGSVTDEFGMRYHPTQYVWKLHSGIDLGGNPEGTNIYSPANGKVVRIIWRSYCGGNQLIINHTINGVAYTTQYMHMLTIGVDVGDVVSKGDVIGTVGGGSGTSSYETCSTGAHLHFMVAKGHYYGSDAESYTSYSTYVDNLINPREVLYFPAFGVWW